MDIKMLLGVSTYKNAPIYSVQHWYNKLSIGVNTYKNTPIYSRKYI
jgi:hypothetical protein